MFLIRGGSGKGKEKAKEGDTPADKDVTAIQRKTDQVQESREATCDQALQQFSHDRTPVELEPHSQGPTLLWSPVAKIISGVTGIGSLYVRASSKIGGWGVTAGREATLKGLEVSRAAVETVLLAAGRDVSSRRTGDLGRQEAENTLDRSISALHTTIASISFMASSGFYLTQATIDSVSAVSIQGLSTLNAVLGSTESSRAVAAIITLIKDELNKPGIGENGEIVTYLDLLVGTVGFVLLQRWGRRKSEIEFRDAGGEETIWDTVIDDRGFRADVVGTKRKDVVTTTKNTTRARPDTEREGSAIVLEKGLDVEGSSVTLSAQDQTALSDEEIRDRILTQLPAGARAVITTETLTMKTVKVEIHHDETANIEPPPGLTMISERLIHDTTDDTDLPSQTVVFRTSLKRSSSAKIAPADHLRLTPARDIDVDGGDTDDVVTMRVPVRANTTEYGSSPPLALTSLSDYEKRLSDSSGDALGPVANQKKSRKPAVEETRKPENKGSRLPVASRKESTPEKSSGLKKALKTLSPLQAQQKGRPSTPDVTRRDSAPVNQSSHLARANQSHRQTPTKRVFPVTVNTGSTCLTSPSPLSPTSRRDPASSFFTMHEKKRESTISQTDTYSIRSAESRPGSPTTIRTHARSGSELTKAKSQTEISMQDRGRAESQDSRHHRQRSRSFVPSLYSMGTKHSDEALILAPKTERMRSIFEDHKMLAALATDGKVPGIFPNQHLVRTVRRFSRFASASYGSNFLRVMGLSPAERDLTAKSNELLALDIHREHSSFSDHTGLPADTILLSSFFDPKGATGNTNNPQTAMSPLIHFISIDHDSKAVVLTCRGTLGFEDVLTDMTCDYDDIYWQGQVYKVHKGIHASARRLLCGIGSRVMATVKTALEEYPTYGFVLCGHSLGGAVAAILAILISEPSQSEFESSGASFVTASIPKLLLNVPSTSNYTQQPQISLPTNRPIHVYAYGSPATVSPGLRLATRGLITTIINAHDIVPCLSLGTLHDFRSVALHLKTDTEDALSMLRTRVLRRVKTAIQTAFYVDKGPPPPENVAGDGIGEDNWAWTALQTLRAQMTHEKLVPPGECFVVETTRVFDRLDPNEDTTGMAGTEESPEARYFRALGRPATRVQFKLVRDVEKRFGELKFGRQMFSDHSPGRYEAGLGALERGIFED